MRKNWRIGQKFSFNGILYRYVGRGGGFKAISLYDNKPALFNDNSEWRIAV